MKRKLAWMGAIGSGLYLLTIGILPDPLPFVDEAIMLAIFVKSTNHLGFNFGRWIPFLARKRRGGRVKPGPHPNGVTIDV